MSRLGSAVLSLIVDTSQWTFDKASQGLQTFASNLNAIDNTLQNVGRGLSSFAGEVNKVGANIANVSREFGSMGIQLGLVGATFETALTRLLKPGAQLEQTFAQIQMSTNAASAEMQKMRDVVDQLGTTTQASSAQAATALNEIVKSVGDVNKALEILPNALNLARATQSDFGNTAKVVTETIQGFNLTASQSAHVADMLDYAAHHGAGSVQEIGVSLNYLNSSATQLHIPLSEILAQLIDLGKRGQTGTRAGMEIAQALERLTRESAPIVDTLKQMGMSAEKINSVLPTTTNSILPLIQAMRDLGATSTQVENLFSSRSGRGMALLYQDGAKAVADLKNQLDGLNGTAAKNAEMMDNTVTGAINRLKASFQTLGGEAFEAFKNQLKGMIEGIQSVVHPIMEWVQAHAQLVGKLLAFGAVAAAVAVAVGTVVTALAGIGLAIDVVVSGVGELAGVFAVAFGSLSAVITTFTNSVLVAGLIANWNKAKEVVQTFAQAALGAIQPFIEGVKTGFDAYIKPAFDRLVAATGFMLSKLRELGQSFGAFNTTAGPIREILGAIASLIGATLVDAVSAAITVIGALAKAFSYVSDVVTGLLTYIPGVTSRMREMQSAADATARSMQTAADVQSHLTQNSKDYINQAAQYTQREKEILELTHQDISGRNDQLAVLQKLLEARQKDGTNVDQLKQKLQGYITVQEKQIKNLRDSDQATDLASQNLQALKDQLAALTKLQTDQTNAQKGGTSAISENIDAIKKQIDANIESAKREQERQDILQKGQAADKETARILGELTEAGMNEAEQEIAKLKEKLNLQMQDLEASKAKAAALNDTAKVAQIQKAIDRLNALFQESAAKVQQKVENDRLKELYTFQATYLKSEKDRTDASIALAQVEKNEFIREQTEKIEALTKVSAKASADVKAQAAAQRSQLLDALQTAAEAKYQKAVQDALNKEQLAGNKLDHAIDQQNKADEKAAKDSRQAAQVAQNSQRDVRAAEQRVADAQRRLDVLNQEQTLSRQRESTRFAERERQSSGRGMSGRRGEGSTAGRHGPSQQDENLKLQARNVEQTEAQQRAVEELQKAEEALQHTKERAAISDQDHQQKAQDAAQAAAKHRAELDAKTSKAQPGTLERAKLDAQQIQRESILNRIFLDRVQTFAELAQYLREQGELENRAALFAQNAEKAQQRVNDLKKKGASDADIRQAQLAANILGERAKKAFDTAGLDPSKAILAPTDEATKQQKEQLNASIEDLKKFQKTLTDILGGMATTAYQKAQEAVHAFLGGWRDGWTDFKTWLVSAVAEAKKELATLGVVNISPGGGGTPSAPVSTVSSTGPVDTTGTPGNAVSAPAASSSSMAGTLVQGIHSAVNGLKSYFSDMLGGMGSTPPDLTQSRLVASTATGAPPTPDIGAPSRDQPPQLYTKAQVEQSDFEEVKKNQAETSKNLEHHTRSIQDVVQGLPNIPVDSVGERQDRLPERQTVGKFSAHAKLSNVMGGVDRNMPLGPPPPEFAPGVGRFIQDQFNQQNAQHKQDIKTGAREQAAEAAGGADARNKRLAVANDSANKYDKANFDNLSKMADTTDDIHQANLKQLQLHQGNPNVPDNVVLSGPAALQASSLAQGSQEMKKTTSDTSGALASLAPAGSQSANQTIQAFMDAWRSKFPSLLALIKQGMGQIKTQMDPSTKGSPSLIDIVNSSVDVVADGVRKMADHLTNVPHLATSMSGLLGINGDLKSGTLGGMSLPAPSSTQHTINDNSSFQMTVENKADLQELMRQQELINNRKATASIGS